MTALTERMRAEQAFQSIQRTDGPNDIEWPSAAARIRTARTERGLDEADVADRLEMSVESYFDLETYDDEAFTVAALSEPAEALSDEIGYDIEPVLASPDAMWEFNVDGLYCVCTALALDWVAALPDLAEANV